MSVPLLAVAHGSRDPRSAATMHALVERIRAARPGLEVRLCFLDLNAPSVDRAVDALAGDGYETAVAVPLLLGNAFHARVDLPRLLASARHRRPALTVHQADVLGDDERIVTAARSRVLDTGADAADDRVGLAVVAVGSSSAAANERSALVARRITAGTGWRGQICFATAAGRSAPEAIARLRAAGVERIVVAPWFLAPGRLTDRVADSIGTDTAMAATIGAHAGLADVVLDRYDTARRADRLVLSA